MTRKFILILFFSFLLTSCSFNNNDTEECTDFYTAILYDGCSCDGAGCTTAYLISEQEYNRLLIIVNNSSESCIMVTVTSVSGADFNGYFRTNLNAQPLFIGDCTVFCPDCIS